VSTSILSKLLAQDHASYPDYLCAKMDILIADFWSKYPDMRELVNKKREKQQQEALVTRIAEVLQEKINEVAPSEPAPLLRGAALRAKIRESFHEIRCHREDGNAEIVPRIQAHNRKCSTESIEEENEFREEAVAAQIKAWRSMLPLLIRRFSRIPDYRRLTHVKHKVTVLMMFGLFAFIFRLCSRREMNRELTSPVVFEHLKKLFPEIDTIPHADTLERLLEKTDPREIEKAHIALIKDLINKKKFKKLLIHGCVPITVDGTQKLYRDGLLQDEHWCERKVGKEKEKQQYVYALEANLTLKNGLNVPLITEYLYTHNNQLLNTEDKQDSETTAFERLAERLKHYFPRLKIILFSDAMYATQEVMGIIHKHHWEFIIRLPKEKLKNFAELLNKRRKDSITLDHPYYRNRRQAFYWESDVSSGYEWQLKLHLIGCLEQYEEVNKKTGEIEPRFVDHAWISSVKPNKNNLYELINHGVRKKELIEDNMNTEKNRGYNYKHAFSYDWNAMQGFHYLMRLAHAVNALSEFSKKLKDYVKSLGCRATFKIIKDALFNPWFSLEWFAEQRLKSPQLRLQLE